MDDIARRLNVDPVELRLKHLVRERDIFVTGEELVSVGVTDCLRRTAEAIGWKGKEEQAAPPEKQTVLRGKGVAVAIKSTTTPTTSSASVRLNADGSAVLLTSSVEIGQGLLTSMAQIIGEELGLPLERVTVSSPDTDLTPYDKSTSSSRTTFHMTAKAPNPNAAKLFIDYFLGAESSAIMASVGEFVNRQGIYPPIPGADHVVNYEKAVQAV